MKSHSEYESEQILKTLVGGKITNILLDRESDSFGFQVKKCKSYFDVWVDMDPEGNGPGHLSIEEQK